MSTTITPLSIAFVISTAAPGGAEGQLTRLATAMAKRGHSVNVYFMAAGGPLTEVLDEGHVPWSIFGAIRADNSRVRKLRELARFAGELHRQKPDVVYTWLPGVTWLALPAAALACRAKRVAAFRGLVQMFEVRTPARRLAFRAALRSAHAVTANAPWLEVEARRWGARKDRVHFMPNGVTLPTATSDVTLQPPRGVVVANFFAYKRHELVLRAIADVPDVEMVLIGSGELLQETKALVYELDLSERTQFVDDCTDVSPLLSTCQFAVHPSRTEGMSNAILEQLAHGLPVIATDVGAARLMVDDGVNGFVVPIDDQTAMTERIIQLTDSPELRTRMGAQARAKAHQFSWEASLIRHEDLFRALVASRRRHATTRSG